MAARKQTKKTKSRRVKRNKKKNSAKRSTRRWKYLLALVLIVVFVVYLMTNNTFWESGNKLTLVTTNDSDVRVVVYDTEIEKITTIEIPGDTLVNVPRSLGSMRIKNVWQLGENEDLGGSLLAETVTKNFRIPVVVWAGENANAFSTGNYFSVVSALFVPYSTNMNFADKFHLALFSIRVKDFKKETIDISKSAYIKEDQLPDGNVGYLVTGKVPKNIAILASDNAFAKEGVRVAIYDGTNVAGYAEEVGMIIEAMGGKVVAVNKVDHGDDCVVEGNDEVVRKRLTLLFSCTGESSGELKGNYDVEFTIGEAFYSRF